MQATPLSAPVDSARYARCIETSKRVRWDIDRDVIRGRRFDLSQKFLPDGLSLAHELAFLTPPQRLFYGQVQGRTYANMFALVERYIGVKMLDISRSHAFGDQIAFEALVRLTDEELKHQALFRRIERLAAEDMPPGYRFELDGNDVAAFVLGKCSWAVLALTCHIELFSQAHYRASIDGAAGLSDLFKDVFLFHWKEESQHAILDELEWAREDATLAPASARRCGRRADRAGRRRRRPAAGAGARRRGVFLCGARPRRHAGRSRRREHAARLPLAVHRVRCDGAALPAGAGCTDEPGADGAHPGRAGAAGRERRFSGRARTALIRRGSATPGAP